MFVLRLTYEVHGHVFDDGHVFGAVSGAQSGEIVVEDDVEDPVEAIFDAQWARTARPKVFASRAAEER